MAAPSTVATASRSLALDYVRIVSTVGVIALHASAKRVDTMPDIDSFGWKMCEVVDACCRWVVPVFIMLSGLLTLGAERFTAVRFYRKRLTRVVIPLAVWSTVYFVWESWRYQYQLDWQVIINALHEGMTCNHLYFLFVILGLYVVTPPLRLAVRATPAAAVWMATIVGYAVVASGVITDHIELDVFSRFAIYIPCFVAGWLLRRHDPRLVKPAIATFVCVTVWMIVGTYHLAGLYARDDEDHAFALFAHFHPAVILQSVSAFIMLRALPEVPGARLRALVPRLSTASFGVYLVHILLLEHLQDVTNTWNPMLMPLTLTVEVVCVTIASTLVALLLMKIPVVSSTVGA